MTRENDTPDFGRLLSVFMGMKAERTGKSGKGSRKGERLEDVMLSSTDTILMEQASRRIAMRMNGKSEMAPLQEAVIMKLFETALGGSVYALKAAIDLLQRAERKQQMEDQAYADYWRNIRQAKYDAIAAAKAAGRPEPQSYPHPDDIEITSDNQVMFHGPMTREAALIHESAARDRDLYILQDNYELRKGVIPASHAETEPSDSSSPLLLATIINDALPKRYQLSQSEFSMRMFDADRHTKRELQTMLYKGFKTPQNNFKRGTVFPSLKTTKALFMTHGDLFRRYRNGEIDLETMPSEELTTMIYGSLCQNLGLAMDAG